MQKNRPIHNGAKFKKITLVLDAEVTEKGQVFLILPKDRFKAHRENEHRFMIQDLQGDK